MPQNQLSPSPLNIRQCCHRHFVILFIVLLLSGCGGSPANRWEAVQDEIDPSDTRLYFTIFLASHNEQVYELAHPDLHDKIRDWQNEHAPMCSDQRMPEDTLILGEDDVVLICNCIVVARSLAVDIIEDYASHHIITGWNSITYASCPEDG